MIVMKVMEIRIPDVETAKQFCRLAGNCPFDIDVFYNRIVIDAKSILGVLSLDFNRVLNVRMYGENAEFEAFCGKLHELVAEVA